MGAPWTASMIGIEWSGDIDWANWAVHDTYGR
jgi:hypothetical protein